MHTILVFLYLPFFAFGLVSMGSLFFVTSRRKFPNKEAIALRKTGQVISAIDRQSYHVHYGDCTLYPPCWSWEWLVMTFVSKQMLANRHCSCYFWDNIADHHLARQIDGNKMLMQELYMWIAIATIAHAYAWNNQVLWIATFRNSKIAPPYLNSPSLTAMTRFRRTVHLGVHISFPPSFLKYGWKVYETTMLYWVRHNFSQMSIQVTHMVLLVNSGWFGDFQPKTTQYAVSLS